MGESALYKKVMRHKGMYLFLLPAIISVILFEYKPMIGVIMAFQDFNIYEGYMHSPFVGLKHFEAFLSNPDFFRALKNTIGLGSLSFIISFPIPIIFALLLNEFRFNFLKRATQTISYLPHFISWIVVSTMVVKFLDQDTGVLNNILAMLNIDRIPFMRDPNYFWGVLIFTSIWKETGWNCIIYLAAISGIDQDMYEAAVIDGANRWKKIIYITLPSIFPTIGLLLVLGIGSLISAGGLFDAIYNLQNPLISEGSIILELYSYYEGIAFSRYSYAAAITLAQSLIALGMVLAANRIYKTLTQESIF